jgi:hypothetical protein
MHADLLRSGRVFAVSTEATMLFDNGLKSLLKVAATCGLTQEDLSKVAEAKKKLRLLQPSTLKERKAVDGLREFLTPEKPKKLRGRPGRVNATDRLQMHADARQLRQEGKCIHEIIGALAQKYELRISYTKRILEDATDSQPKI